MAKEEHQESEQFTLILRAPANDRLKRTAVMRLKGLLKAAWRAYGLRAEYLAPVETKGVGECDGAENKSDAVVRLLGGNDGKR